MEAEERRTPEQNVPEAPEKENAVQKSREKMRRNILHIAAGGYLLYLSWQLFSGFAAEIGQKGWMGDMIISLVGGVVFTATGGGLLVSALVRMVREQRSERKS